MVNDQTHGRLGNQQKVLGPLNNISQLWNLSQTLDTGTKGVCPLSVLVPSRRACCRRGSPSPANYHRQVSFSHLNRHHIINAPSEKTLTVISNSYKTLSYLQADGV